MKIKIAEIWTTDALTFIATSVDELELTVQATTAIQAVEALIRMLKELKSPVII